MPLITTSGSVQEIFPRNTNRISFTIKNEDSTNSVFVKRERSELNTVSSTDHDHVIGPGGSLSLNSLLDGTTNIQERWTCKASAGSPVIAWFETENIIR